jgi:hypothetical protein
VRSQSVPTSGRLRGPLRWTALFCFLVAADAVATVLRTITAESANFVLIDIFVFWFACVMLASTPGASAMSCTKCRTVRPAESYDRMAAAAE